MGGIASPSSSGANGFDISRDLSTDIYDSVISFS
jgi:hypothetical protein